MGKLKVKKAKTKLKKRIFRPIESDLNRLESRPFLPNETSNEELEFMKLKQGCLLQASQEILDRSRDEILLRAIDLMQEKSGE